MVIYLMYSNENSLLLCYFLQMSQSHCLLKLIKYTILPVLLPQYFTSTTLWRYVVNICTVSYLSNMYSCVVIYTMSSAMKLLIPSLYLVHSSCIVCLPFFSLRFLLDFYPTYQLLNNSHFFGSWQTIKTNVIGTLNMLGLAKRVGARCILTFPCIC